LRDLEANMERIGPSRQGLKESVPLRPSKDPAEQGQDLVDRLGAPLWILAQVLLQEFREEHSAEAHRQGLRELGQRIPEGTAMGFGDGCDRQVPMSLNKPPDCLLGLGG
jgi:hypothetical protein